MNGGKNEMNNDGEMDYTLSIGLGIACCRAYGMQMTMIINSMVGQQQLTFWPRHNGYLITA